MRSCPLHGPLLCSLLALSACGDPDATDKGGVTDSGGEEADGSGGGGSEGGGSEGGGSEGGGSEGGGSEGGEPEPELSRGCDEGDYTVDLAEDGSQRVLTEHYILTMDAAADAQDMARLVEAAWEAYSTDLGAEPAVDGPLELTLFPNAESWAAGLESRGIPVPTGSGGYYDPGTRFASLYRQPTLYFTQMLLLHEQYHQFHLLSRSRSDSLPTWYVEGLAEWASRHDWDGLCVAIGADPRGTWEDYWAQAADGLAERGSDLAAWVEEDSFPGRPEMMALVHLLEREDRDAWRAYREGRDFADPIELPASAADSALAAHVLGHQEPLTPIWLDWLHRDPHTLRGLSSDAITVMLYKEPPERLAFEVPLTPGSYVGGVYGWDATGFDVVFVDPSGSVSRWVYTPELNEWLTIGTLEDPSSPLRWEQEGDLLLLNGQDLGLKPVLDPAAGYALYNGTVDFTDLED